MTAMNEMGEFVDTAPPQPWERIVDPPKNPPAFEVRTCPLCGKEFEPNSNNQKFCSAECRLARQAQVFSKRRREGRYKRGRNR